MANDDAPVNVLTEAQFLSFYSNPELEAVDDYLGAFLSSTQSLVANDEFYRCVASYCKACHCKEEYVHEQSYLEKQWTILWPTVWHHDSRVVLHRGKCGDGRDASATYTVKKAKINSESLDELRALMKTLTSAGSEKCVTVCSELHLAEMKCQNFAQNCVKRFLDTYGLTSDHPVYTCFLPVDHSSEAEQIRRQLKHCCSVLFHFIRQPGCPKSFLDDVKRMLHILIGSLNRMASAEDHYFVLSHLLRCPQGVGEWAKNFVQPLSQSNLGFLTPVVDHFVALLSLLLSPIRQRETYLKEYSRISVNDDSWAVVDVDGEVESDLIRIPESDLLSFVDQFDIERALYIFLDDFNRSDLTEKRMIVVFSFAHALIKILQDGLRTYGNVQYQQLCRRIGLMIRQTVQCVGSCWRYYRLNASNAFSPRSAVSLADEFDSLLCRCVSHVLSMKNLGVWQVLVDLPFDLLSMNSRHRAVRLLLTDDRRIACGDSLKTPVDNVENSVENCKILEHRLSDLSETDATYLLAALGSLICVIDDEKLISSTVVQIFYACFVNDDARRAYRKIGKQILRDVALLNASVVTRCIELIDKNLSAVGGYALELMFHLPVDNYSMQLREWLTVERWLNFPLQSMPNALARQILLTLNFGYFATSNDRREPLFISAPLHLDIGSRLARLHEKFCPEPPPSNVVAGSMKRAAKLASSVQGTVDFADQFDQFCWNVLIRLKLNGLENGSLTRNCKSQSTVDDYIRFQLNCDKMDNFPDLFACVEKLISKHKYKAACCCLQAVLPNFAANNAFLDNDRFIQIISRLMYSDETYLRYAAQLLGSDATKENLNFFGDLLSHLALTIGSTPFIEYALKLVHNSDPIRWKSNKSYVCLIDKLIDLSFAFDQRLQMAIDCLSNFYKNIATIQAPKKGILTRIFGDGSRVDSADLSLLSVAPFFTFASILAEISYREPVYDQFKREMLLFPSIAPEVSLKKSCSKHNISTSIDRLPALLLLECCQILPPSHAIYPLLLQNFCHYFFCIVASSDASSPPANLSALYISLAGDKIRLLVEKISREISLLKEKDGEKNNVVKSRIKMFSNVKSWIMDISSSGKNVQSIVQSVNCYSDSEFWRESIDREYLNDRHWSSANRWRQLRRLNVVQLPSAHRSAEIADSIDCLSKMLKKLNHDSKCRPTEAASPIATSDRNVASLLSINPDLLIDFSRLSRMVDEHFKPLNSAARAMHNVESELAKLNEEYFNFVTKLYSETEEQISVQLKCTSFCQNPNRLKLNVLNFRTNDLVNKRLINNRQTFDSTIKSVTSLCNGKICSHLINLCSITDSLSKLFISCQNFDPDLHAVLRSNGVQLFYRVISSMEDRSLQFTPSRLAFKQTIEALGQIFVYGNADQAEPFFDLLNANRDSFDLLLPYFSPMCADIATVYNIYCRIIESKLDENIWRGLLQKFDLSEILRKCDLTQSISFHKATVRGYSASNESKFASVSEIYRSHCAFVSTYNIEQTFAIRLYSMLEECVADQGISALLADLVNYVRTADRPIPRAAVDESVRGLWDVLVDKRTRCAGCAKLGLLHCLTPFALDLSNLSNFLIIRIMESRAVDPTQLLMEEASALLDETYQALIRCFGPWIEAWIDGSGDSAYAGWSPEQNVLAQASFFANLASALSAMQQKFSQLGLESAFLRKIWFYYAERVASPNARETRHYDSFRNCLLKLRWKNCTIDFAFIESMRQILIMAPAEAHVLVADIVVRIPWSDAIERLTDCSSEPADLSLFYSSLLDVILRCAANKENLKDCKASYPRMMNNINSLQWNLIDLGRLNDFLLFFVGTFGVDSVFSFQDDACRLVLKLLEKAAEFLPLATCQTLHGRQNRLQRRRMLVDTLMKCLVFYCGVKDSATDFAGRYFVDAVDRIDLLIRMIDDDEIRIEEATTLLQPVMKTLNEIDAARYFDAIQLYLFAWLDSHSDAELLPHLITHCGGLVADVRLRLNIQEKCIFSYFQRGHPKPNWLEICKFLSVSDNLLPNYVAECKSRGHYFSLYAFFMQQLPCCRQLSDETLIIRDILSILAIFREKPCAEPVILLFVGLTLELIERQLNFGGFVENAFVLTSQLVDHLKFFSSEAKGGILGVIGLVKRPPFTNRFKIVASLLQRYVEHQTLEENRLRTSVDQPIVSDQRSFIESLKTTKQYADFKGAINLTSSYLSNDNSNTFLHSYRLYSQLLLILYNEKYLIDKCCYLT